MEQCLLCNIVTNENGEREKPVNSVLHEDSKFMVLPALGALTPGYVLIIPKAHVYSMADMSQKDINWYFDLTKEVSDYLAKEYKVNPIMFEHGSDKKGLSKSPTSIVHAHSHIVPINFNQDRHQEILRECKMNEIININSNLKGFGGHPYLLYVNEESKAFITKYLNSLPSQILRKKVADELKMSPEYNWREHGHEDNVAKTIKAWKHANLVHRFNKGFLNNMCISLPESCRTALR